MAKLGTGGGSGASGGGGVLALGAEEQCEGDERTPWGGGRESDASALSMAQEAELFWEVSRGEIGASGGGGGGSGTHVSHGRSRMAI